VELPQIESIAARKDVASSRGSKRGSVSQAPEIAKENVELQRTNSLPRISPQSSAGSAKRASIADSLHQSATSVTAASNKLTGNTVKMLTMPPVQKTKRELGQVGKGIPKATARQASIGKFIGRIFQ